MKNTLTFKTASYCPPGSIACVAVAYKDGVVSVMDTKNPKQAALNFNGEEWDKFVKGVKNGEFDY